MSLVRFDLGSELDELRREVNRVFTGLPLMQLEGEGRGMHWVPPMDTVEEDGVLTIMLDVPGMSEEDLDVEVADDVLTIRGRRSIEREEQGQRWHRFERASGRFERALQMPSAIDPDAVRATFDRGVLTVSLPSAERAVASGRHIQITAASEER